VVNPLEARLVESTRLAHSGMLFQGHGLWLYSRYEKTHGYLNPENRKSLTQRRKNAKKTCNLLAINPVPTFCQTDMPHQQRSSKFHFQSWYFISGLRQ